MLEFYLTATDKRGKRETVCVKAETATGDPALLSEDDSPNTKLVTGPKGEKVMATHQNTVLGVPKHKIPEGQEDLYILKSEVVPPVCPACPSGSVCPRDKPCPGLHERAGAGHEQGRQEGGAELRPPSCPFFSARSWTSLVFFSGSSSPSS